MTSVILGPGLTVKMPVETPTPKSLLTTLMVPVLPVGEAYWPTFTLTVSFVPLSPITGEPSAPTAEKLGNVMFEAGMPSIKFEPVRTMFCTAP